MSTAQTLSDLEYPESDDMPMGETDLHKRWIIRLYELMRQRYRGQRVYVGADLLVYYVEGLPYKFVVPDVFVVLDCEPGDRRIFQTWVEQRPPTVVFEVTSRYTRHKDAALKPQLYAEMGVKELFLYDPTGDYLSPPLAGFRMYNGQPTVLETDAGGRLESQELGLLLSVDSGELVVVDRQTMQPLVTEAEAAIAALESVQSAYEREQSARKREESARKREENARKAAEERASAAEAEIARLREEMARRNQGG